MSEKEYGLFKNWMNQEFSFDLIGEYSFINDSINLNLSVKCEFLKKIDHQSILKSMIKKIKKHNSLLRPNLIYDEKWKINIGKIEYSHSENLNIFLSNLKFKYKNNYLKYKALAV